MLAQASQGGDNDTEARNALLRELEIVEKAKQALDLSNGQEKMEEFALRVFGNTDASDREGTANLVTVKGFFAASIFLDACAQFYDNELPPDLQEKSKYAKYRTFQIRDALKQGATPPPPSSATTVQPGEESSSASSQIPPANIAPSAQPTAQPIPPAAPAASPMPSSANATPFPAGIPPSQGLQQGALSSQVQQTAHKKVTHAVSALDFNDAATARQLLQEALALLEGRA